MFQLKELKSKNSPPVIQPALKIGRPGDKYEQEADRVAEQVMRMSESETIRQQPEEEEEELMPKLRMQPIEEEEEEMMPKLRMQPVEEEEEMLQPKTKNSGDIATHDITQNLNSTRGNGQGLPPGTNDFMSHAFGSDFSDVKIHTGTKAVQMNRQLGARAFTYGNDIYFNAGEYNPESTAGKRLLAHELTHVVQQKMNLNNQISRQTNPENAVENSGIKIDETPSAEMTDELLAEDIIRTQIAILNGWDGALQIFDKVLTSASDKDTKPDFNKVVKTFFEEKLLGTIISYSKVKNAGEAFALLGKLTDELNRATAALESARLRDFYVEHKKAIIKMKQKTDSIQADFKHKVIKTRENAEAVERNAPSGVSIATSPQSDAYAMMRMYLVELRDKLNNQLKVSTPEILFQTLSEQWIKHSKVYAGMGLYVPAVVIIRVTKDYKIIDAKIEGTGGQKIAEQLLKDSPEGVDVFSMKVPRRVLVVADNGYPSAILRLDENNRNTNTGSFAEGNWQAVQKYVLANGLPPTKNLTGD